MLELQQNSRGIQSKCITNYNELNHKLTFLNVGQSVVQTAPITTQLLLPETTSMTLVILHTKKSTFSDCSLLHQKKKPFSSKNFKKLTRIQIE